MSKYKKQVYLGFDREGKQIRKWVYGETKAELERNALRLRVEKEKVPNLSCITFGKFSETWLTVYKGTRSKQTVAMYKNALKHCAELDPVPIRKITRSMCQETIVGCWDHPRTAKIVSGALRQIFRAAAADGLIAVNPAEALSLPKPKEKRFHLLTDEELEIGLNIILIKKINVKIHIQFQFLDVTPYLFNNQGSSLYFFTINLFIHKLLFFCC